MVVSGSECVALFAPKGVERSSRLEQKKGRAILRGREGLNGGLPPLTHDRVSNVQTRETVSVDACNDWSLLHIFSDNTAPYSSCS
jgi:hypothetical protein